jgi:isopenicillin-N N-acyltransferase-like protein
MLFIECKGNPYEVRMCDVTIKHCPVRHTEYLRQQIGYQHGQAAKIHIDRCITFYAKLFLKNCKIEWPQVLAHASSFEQQAKSKWPAYHEEMQGIADGAGKQLLDIVAINVRTEINFGLFSDGCTALSWHTEKRAWLGQNWDVRTTSPINLWSRNTNSPD